MRVIGTALLASALCVLLTSCKSHPFGPYVSPGVMGKVMDASTGRPLAGVTVSRTQPEKWSREIPRGGEKLVEPAPIYTDSDGGFQLASERVLSVVRGSAWSDVRLNFQLRHYATLRTNFSILNETNTPSGWRLDAGIIRLTPLE